MSQGWAVFISGRGSNLQTLLSVQNLKKIKLVVSNKKDVAGVRKARRFGIPVIFMNQTVGFEEISRQLRRFKITHIFLLGFMKLVPASFIENFKGFIINLHPSLLPLHKGLHAIENSHADQCSMGISIHYVNEQMDEGEVILQRVTVGHLKKSDFNRDSFLISLTEQFWTRHLFLKWNLNEKI